MSKITRDFYIWTIYECIKNTYQWWGIDLTSMSENIKKDFSNSYEALHKVYEKLQSPDFYASNPIFFKKPTYVYELISNLIPLEDILYFDTTSKPQKSKYHFLHMPHGCKLRINRIDLIIAIYLFCEDFLFTEITSNKVTVSNHKLTVYGKFNTIKITSTDTVTYVCINIRNVIKFQYQIYTNK